MRTAKAGWELPGGRVERGESLHDALQREVREETGHTLRSIGQLRGVYCHVSSNMVLLVFRAIADAQEGSPPPDEDVLEVGWFTTTDALNLVTHPSEHDRLTDALGTNGNVAYRDYP